MSKKINILSIITGHCASLRNSDKSFNLIDFITFFIAPLVLATLGMSYVQKLTDGTISLLVNFGSIFTALLLSVLVLIFDQENKADEQYEKYLIFKEDLEKNPKLSDSAAYSWIFSRNLDENYFIKKDLLKELYYNISFSIVVSLLLVLFCLIYSNINLLTNVNYQMYSIKILVFLISFLMITIFLNILMIVKRMHVMLTN
ncbi:hypothetical protein RFY44_05765 [Acinetobacter bereziniae]|uniref:hypothetical protein n=1 Tax=Acinetobacter TaxID=469 RepID=UPI000452649F|nr:MULTISPECIES: hypothetical protein [Acinetobacter]EXC24852.1 hypothetical protein J536_3807 [Acinetobacter sp. 809848]MCM8510879.1 hypothetical protein [Acinetobacter bereziniae]MDQ9818387.1 hypothetical protein [Acinetobacter bereziniae]